MAGHPYDTSQSSEMHNVQVRSYPHMHPPMPTGHKMYVPPTNDAPVGGFGPTNNGSMAMRSSYYQSSSFPSVYPVHRSANPGTVHSSYMNYSTAASSDNNMPSHLQPGPCSSYSQRSEGSTSTVGSQVDNRRVALKRKSHVLPLVADGINASGYYAGSSSNVPFSNYIMPSPIPTVETRPSAIPPNVAPSNWNNHVLAHQEESQRNVRGRHNNAFPLEAAATAAYSASNFPPPFFSNTNAPAPNIPAEWNQAPVFVAPQGGILPPGAAVSNSISLRDRAYYPAPHNTSVRAPVPTLHVPRSQEAVLAHGGYNQRSTAHNVAPPNYPPVAPAVTSMRAVTYEAIPGYLPTASASTSFRVGPPYQLEAPSSSRYSRHVPTAHNGGVRSSRARSSYSGFHEDTDFGRPERPMLMEQLIIYESREAYDPHWNMRLDIDDMSYEELLALEERIGNVNTGLANEKISSCLIEVRCSSDQAQSQEDGNCAICLDEYKDQDLLGKLKCGHDFHSGCIKKWLQMKNSCPICKGTVAEDSTKGRENTPLLVSD